MATALEHYIRASLKIEGSTATALSDLDIGLSGVPEWKHKMTASHFYGPRHVLVTTGGKTIELGQFTTVKDVLVVNMDPTNFLDATFRNTANGANDNIVRVEAAYDTSHPTWRFLGAMTPANDLVLAADTADVNAWIYVFGT